MRMTAQRQRILMACRRFSGSGSRTLAEHLGLSETRVSDQLQTLEKDGYVDSANFLTIEGEQFLRVRQEGRPYYGLPLTQGDTDDQT